MVGDTEDPNMLKIELKLGCGDKMAAFGTTLGYIGLWFPTRSTIHRFLQLVTCMLDAHHNQPTTHEIRCYVTYILVTFVL